MTGSKYEIYVVRKPGIITNVTSDSMSIEVPEGKIPSQSSVNTGPLVIFSDDFLKDTDSKVEYGFITGDTTIGDGNGLAAHKHEYAEIFLFLGTDPKDTTYLGAEAEFWLGEGDATEQIKMNTSSSVFVPPGLAHFPLILRKVKNPVMMVVIVPSTSRHKSIPVDR